jgi:hypothetical protein
VRHGLHLNAGKGEQEKEDKSRCDFAAQHVTKLFEKFRPAAPFILSSCR